MVPAGKFVLPHYNSASHQNRVTVLDSQCLYDIQMQQKKHVFKKILRQTFEHFELLNSLHEELGQGALSNATQSMFVSKGDVKIVDHQSLNVMPTPLTKMKPPDKIETP